MAALKHKLHFFGIFQICIFYPLAFFTLLPFFLTKFRFQERRKSKLYYNGLGTAYKKQRIRIGLHTQYTLLQYQVCFHSIQLLYLMHCMYIVELTFSSFLESKFCQKKRQSRCNSTWKKIKKNWLLCIISRIHCEKWVKKNTSRSL